MKCPHCLVDFHLKWDGASDKIADSNVLLMVRWTTCPSCERKIIQLYDASSKAESLIYPRTISRTPLPQEVSEQFANDYREACIVLADSPKASAALSRRCLQHLLREQFNVKHGNLSAEIDQVLKKLPPHLEE